MFARIHSPATPANQIVDLGKQFLCRRGTLKSAMVGVKKNPPMNIERQWSFWRLLSAQFVKNIQAHALARSAGAKLGKIPHRSVCAARRCQDRRAFRASARCDRLVQRGPAATEPPWRPSPHLAPTFFLFLQRGRQPIEHHADAHLRMVFLIEARLSS